MELLKDTPLEVGWLIWQPSSERHAMTVVVKATFDLPKEGLATLADEQRFPTGDEHYDDDVEASIAWGSDLELLKTRGECFVVGSFHAPHGIEVQRSAVAFTIGAVSKQLAVIGDRQFRSGGGVSEPTGFVTMPLRWERSFGGKNIDANPVGRGRGDELPNIEHPDQLIEAAGERPIPIGCAPIPRMWKQRRRYAGTYDAQWLAERYPHLASDADFRLFQSAPEDQQIEGFWVGDETLRLRHLHPEHPLVECRLPGIRAQALLVSTRGDFTDVGLRLDTIAIDADAGQAVAVWRGVTDASPELEGIKHLFVVHQEAGQEHKVADYEAWYARVLEEAVAQESDEEPEDAPEWPDADRPATDRATLDGDLDPAALQAKLARRLAAAEGEEQPFVDPEAPGAKWAHLDQAMTVGGDDAALKSSLAEELEKRRAEEKSAAFRPVFDDALGAAEPKEEPTLSPEEQLALEMELALGDIGAPEESDARRAVKDALRAQESLAEVDLSGIDLSGVELSGGDFSGAVLAGANLSGVFARGANFDGASLVDGELSSAVFEGCTFVEADLSPARGEHIRMTECRFEGATASDLFLRNARFIRCTFVGTELVGSDLTDAYFEECTLDSVDLSAAILVRAKFVRCTLIDAWLEGARASGANFDQCDCSLLRASEEAVFEGASFKQAKLDGARFVRSKMRGSDFSLASMERADLSGALLAQSRLMGCNLRGARFDGATLVQASFLKSNLYQARFEGANLKHADLRGCNLYQAELFNAVLDDARLDLANLHGTRVE